MLRLQTALFFCSVSTAIMLVTGTADAATPEASIAAIRAVGPRGEGHAAAMTAVQELSQADASTIPQILQAFDGATPLASNWLLGALEVVADRALAQKTLDAKTLEAFVVDTANHARARRIAYEWLLKVDPTAEQRLIPGMLTDPGAEFRRDAVALRLEKAAKLSADGKTEDARAVFEEALQGAVDDDQVKAIVKPLKEQGVKVDLQRHFGFLPDWKLIGPFDNTDKQGFNVAYPPERELNFTAKYAGKEGEIAWQEFSTDDDYGKVNLAKALSPFKGAITYAATVFDSDRPRNVELRLGTPNAWKLWVNGELVFAREEYHRGSKLDQYRVPVSLKAGQNTILLKVCQNEQTEDWAQAWEYQIRVCDSAGAAIAPAGRLTSQVK